MNPPWALKRPTAQQQIYLISLLKKTENRSTERTFFLFLRYIPVWPSFSPSNTWHRKHFSRLYSIQASDTDWIIDFWPWTNSIPSKRSGQFTRTLLNNSSQLLSATYWLFTNLITYKSIPVTSGLVTHWSDGVHESPSTLCASLWFPRLRTPLVTCSETC